AALGGRGRPVTLAEFGGEVFGGRGAQGGDFRGVIGGRGIEGEVQFDLMISVDRRFPCRSRQVLPTPASRAIGRTRRGQPRVQEPNPPRLPATTCRGTELRFRSAPHR